MGASHLSGPLTSAAGFVGAVTGNISGNITGNVTGDVTGNLTGNVTGDVTGNLTGAVTGNVTGDLTGNSAGVHTGGVVSSSVNIGSGGAITFAKKASVSVDLPSIATLAVEEVSVTVTGAAAGDAVIANPPATLAAGLMFAGAYVSGADTVKLRVYNSTGGSIDEAAANWVFMLIR